MTGGPTCMKHETAAKPGTFSAPSQRAPMSLSTTCCPNMVPTCYKIFPTLAEYRDPETAKRLNVSGKVFVRFVVEKDGSPSQVQVIKGIGAGCDEEAIKVIENSPHWIPAKQRGRPVRVYMTTLRGRQNPQ